MKSWGANVMFCESKYRACQPDGRSMTGRLRVSRNGIVASSACSDTALLAINGGGN